MMMNRGRIEIMASILTFCAQPRLKTQIMYNAGITFKQFETYHALLSSQGLLDNSLDGYVTTEKGHRFVHAFKELWASIDGFPNGKAAVRSFTKLDKANGML